MRRGFGLVELLVVLAVVNVVAAIAVPRYQHAVTAARATQIAVDIRTLSQAAESYYADHHAWPPDAGEGSLPGGLEPYLPPGLALEGADYTLEWENWSVPEGNLVGVAVTAPDPRLGQAVSRLMRSEAATLTLEERHTFFVNQGNGRGNGRGNGPPH